MGTTDGERQIVAFDFDGTLTVRDSFTAFLKWRASPWRFVSGMARLTPAALRYVLDRDRERLKAAAVAEFLTARQLSSHPQLQALGPDLADPEFDAEEVHTRMRSHGGDTIEQALLNQRVVAGVGNVLKSEVLFTSGVNPE